MKNMLLSLLVLTSVFVFSYDYTFYDLGIANRVAKIEDKPLLIYFSSPSCIYCKKFENEVLSSKEFQEILKAAYIFVKINPNNKKTVFLDKEFTNNELFSAFGIRGTPTFVFWHQDKAITSIPGYMPLNDFKKALMYILRFLYENYKETFKVYSKKDDFYLGNKKIISVSKDDFDFAKENDKNSIFLDSLNEDINPYNVYLTKSKDIAKKLSKNGALRVLILEE
ncbi:thioredoxin fold domain-containing protein [Thermosipho sp. 1223]|uniref:thioredoxin family protein n=1 Tax=Thermosipho sp. 1223 TaxID=1643332 RepID=UPI00098690A8|nr:thioredoxin fold domain-containing protein [Thermosipho sp. 1223]OOC46414.1 thioredoxin [Thermosipho sp. 1223]